jgi:hypothetical protein
LDGETAEQALASAQAEKERREAEEDDRRFALFCAARQEEAKKRREEAPKVEAARRRVREAEAEHRKEPNPFGEPFNEDGRAADGWPVVDFHVNPGVTGIDKVGPVVLNGEIDAQAVKSFKEYIVYLVGRGQTPELNVLLPPSTRDMIWILALYLK